MKVFWILFACLLVWEIVPEVSIFFIHSYDQISDLI
jgi:hypothetical protein